VIVDNDSELRIEITVCPNFELEEQILKQGDRVTVLEPQWLRENIKKRINDSLLNYDK
jgi:predicted DNA-binding transcriptional regulator YafY